MKVLNKFPIFWGNQPKTTQVYMHPSKNEDEEIVLIQGLRANDSKAMARVYVKNWNYIRALIHKNGGTIEDAQDIFQEALIVLIENLKKEDFQLTCKISTYLYSVARNLWLSQWRKSKPFVDTGDYIAIEQQLAADLVETEDDAFKLPTDEKLRKAIEDLGHPCQKLLISFYYEKRKMSEIVARMPELKNENNARKRKYDCIKQLKKLFGSE